MVRDAWEDWNTDRRRAAVKAVLNRAIVNPHVGYCKCYALRIPSDSKSTRSYLWSLLWQ